MEACMEDEYKVVYAVSNNATFDDLQWPRTPVSRSQYSSKANILQTVHAMAFTAKYIIKCRMRLWWVYSVCRQHTYIFKWHKRRMVPQQQLSFLFNIASILRLLRSVIWAIKRHNLSTGALSVVNVVSRPCHWKCTNALRGSENLGGT